MNPLQAEVSSPDESRREMGAPAIRRAVIGGVSSDQTARVLLGELGMWMRALGVDALTRGNVEIAVAEALNNIVEHAYDGRAGQPVSLQLELYPQYLDLTLCDRGRQMPGEWPPRLVTPDVTGPRPMLPEGGFGWVLIHSLSRAVRYDRVSGENRLWIRFARADADPS